MAVTVRRVVDGGAASEAGFQPGDRIVRINGQEVRDAVDFLYLTGDADLFVEGASPDGEGWEAEIELVDGEPLGVELDPDRVRVCANKCVFCFVDQMPKGLRKTLYIKDDDWRTSFLHGSYVTLTNLTEDDVSRIIKERTSPLYVSVHASDDTVRSRLLGNASGRASFDIVRRLAREGIQMHTQAVVCEDINDGETLRKTILDLWALRPATLSLSVVPVGLTRFRADLPGVRPVSRDGARRILDIIRPLQGAFLAEGGTRFVFAADELYLLSGEPFPPAEAYEDFSQLENGVGLVADFLDGARRGLELASPLPNDRTPLIGLVTGTGFFPLLSDLAASMTRDLGVRLETIAVENEFFGSTVNVAGLLTGADVGRAIQGMPWNLCLLPSVMFRDAGDKSLDGLSLSDISRASGIRCLMASADGERFIRQVLELSGS